MRDEILPEHQANLDELAGNLISEVNTLHAAGYTLAGATGMGFFADFLTPRKFLMRATIKGQRLSSR